MAARKAQPRPKRAAFSRMRHEFQKSAIKWALGVIKGQSLEVLVAIRISSPMTTAMGLQERKKQTTMP
jgi:hypothetical protein